MPVQVFGNQALAVQLYVAFNGVAPGNPTYNNFLATMATTTPVLFAKEYGNTFGTVSHADLALRVLTNLGVTAATTNQVAYDALLPALTTLFAAFPNDRGVIVHNIVKGLANLEGNATYGAAAAAFNATTFSAYNYASNPVNTQPSDASLFNTYILTANTDVATANIFQAGLVFTPGGDDRINALQDEDQLTGTGTNPTLNATLGNANDQGGMIITPTLNGIQTVNVAFTGSGGGAGAVQGLDLQDATGVDVVNISRVSQTVNFAEVGNIKQAASKLSVSNSNSNNAGTVEFSFAAGALAGANATELTVSNVQLLNLNVGQNTSGMGAGAGGVGATGFETVALHSTGANNTIGNLNLPMDTGTAGAINIHGDTNLNISTTANVLNAGLVEAAVRAGGIAGNYGRLATVDASGLTGALTMNIAAGMLTTGKAGTSGVNQDVTITGTANADTFYLNEVVQAGDLINGGDGADTVVVFTGGVTTGTISKVETADIQLTGNVMMDMDRMPDTTAINVRNIDNTLAAGVRTSADNGNWTAQLSNLTATQGAALSIQHSTTNNGGIGDTIIDARLKSSTNANDLVGVDIREGVNADPRFNFTLITNADDPATAGTERVESVTITNSDTESNSVELASAASHRGTITLKGGLAGTFLNLDVNTAAGHELVAAVTAAKAAYDAAPTLANLIALEAAVIAGGAATGLRQIDVTGYAVSGPAAPMADGVGMVDVGALATQVRLVAGTINAADEVSDVILRVSTTAANTDGGQSITMGAGNDTVIFDDIAATSGTRANAGLTNADTVKGGAGNNTLAIDGNGVNVVLQQSEWDNVSGFQTIYLAGTGGFQYFLQLDNDMIVANGTGGTMITIDNDDDSTVNTATNADSRASNSALRLDATTLSAATHFTYDGEEGTGATADRFVVNDQNTNGGNVIDGGDVSVTVGVDGSGVTRQLAGVQSADVMEVRNTATVTTADLANVRNVGFVVINNDQAVLQTLNLTLNTAVVDALSDSGHTASLTEIETLTVQANDGLMTDAAGTALATVAASRIVMDARGVGGAFGLTVLGDTVFAANDAVSATVNLGGAAQTYNLSLGAADTVNLFGLNGTPGTDAVAISTVVAGVQTLTFSNSGTTSTQTFTLTGVEVLNLFTSAGAAAVMAGGVVFAATAGADTMLGTNLADTLDGLAGADVISGGAGNDVIIGGAGIDTLTGDAGSDTFAFNTIVLAADANNITDFVAGAGGDVLRFDAATFTDFAAAAAVTFATAAAATADATAGADNIILRDTAAAITGYNSAGAGAALAIATDTGAIYYDADGDFTGGAVIIGTITAAQVAALVSANILIV